METTIVRFIWGRGRRDDGASTKPRNASNDNSEKWWRVERARRKLQGQVSHDVTASRMALREKRWKLDRDPVSRLSYHWENATGRRALHAAHSKWSRARYTWQRILDE